MTRSGAVFPAVLLAPALFVALALASCGGSAPATSATNQSPAPPAAAVTERQPAAPIGHDLSRDETMGGHTLARHVGKTDGELIARLRREPQISNASTYTDRETAEQVVTAALEAGGRSFDAWRGRTGRRPNFVLRYAADHTIGRTMIRGRTQSVPCRFALVILRWREERRGFYVLTSYPEEHR